MSDPAGLYRALPEVLQERARPLNGEGLRDTGEFVLVWMRVAVRGHENPALDVALEAGRRLDLPVFVYHAVSERTPYASDRHHWFIAQGARDVSRELAARGVGYAFHMERPGARGRHLAALAERAALVVTEDFPCEPIRGWTVSLARGCGVALWCVDTACVAPMQLVGRAYTRAYAYRDATRDLYDARVSAPWEEAPVERRGFVPPDLPFTPVDLEGPLAPLIEACAIDHGVGPVADTPGGSEAGYRRWSAYRRRGLGSYAQTRNDPLKSGASRMSAYLHYGMVSPLRLAREAAGRGGPGATKYLDELLIWRELAWSYCMFRDDHDQVETLPGWARETLAAHERDVREASPSWETLARGVTGDRLWDACQASLRVRGELHNNVRMTWGKALVGWAPDAETALAWLIDLNHRYALDGRDPASYGGILWCLGQFDRPFQPEQPVLGRVRSRWTREHARRLKLEAYEAKVRVPPCGYVPRVEVRGSGVAAAVCARTLGDHGWEASYGGARSAEARFEVDDARLRRFVESWVQDGVVRREGAEWVGDVLGHVAGGLPTPRPPVEEVLEVSEGGDVQASWLAGVAAAGRALGARGEGQPEQRELFG